MTSRGDHSKRLKSSVLMKKYNEELIILKVFTDCLVLVNRFTRKKRFQEKPSKGKNNNVSIKCIFAITDRNLPKTTTIWKKTWFFGFSTHVHPRRALFNFRRFSRMHYSEHRSLENERPNILVSTRFTFILSRDFVFFKNIKMCLMHGNVDKCLKNIAKLSKTKKKIQCFQTLAHVAPRRAIFMFTVYA